MALSTSSPAHQVSDDVCFMKTLSDDVLQV
jgi:hypothetical protein